MVRFYKTGCCIRFNIRFILETKSERGRTSRRGSTQKTVAQEGSDSIKELQGATQSPQGATQIPLGASKDADSRRGSLKSGPSETAGSRRGSLKTPKGVQGLQGALVGGRGQQGASKGTSGSRRSSIKSEFIQQQQEKSNGHGSGSRGELII